MKERFLRLIISLAMMESGLSLKCYSDREGLQWTRCDEQKGFLTCFTKYDQRGLVTARGCSTKDRILHIECENHVMGKTSEKFCYCRTFLCNTSSLQRTSQLSLLLVICFVLRRIFHSEQ